MRLKDSDSGPNLVAIDPQGRACLPGWVREDFGLTKDGRPLYLAMDPLHRVLAFRSNQGIDEYGRELAKDFSKVRTVDVLRYLHHGKVAVSMDSRGRIAIPENMRMKAGLDDRAYVIAMSDRLELVNAEQDAAWTEEVEDLMRADMQYA